MKLFSFSTGEFKLDGGAMFGVVPKVLWEKVYPADEKNRVTLTMKSLLIDTGNRVIIIDTGIGNKQDEKFYLNFGLTKNYNIIDKITELGYSPQQITDIIHTHLHFDHCGWTISRDDKGNFFPTFPNAKVWVSKLQWQAATEPNPRERASFLKENILPIRDLNLLNFIEEEKEFCPDIHIRFAHGHTSGQILVFIKYQDRWLLHGGDLFPIASVIYEPWIMSYDLCALTTLEDKKRILTEVFEKNAVIFLEHDIYQECATVTKTEKGTKVDKTFNLSEFINNIY